MTDENELKEKIQNCHRCPLYSQRYKVIVGRGNIHSKIMIVGEGPGRTEDQKGVAFVGPSGQLLFKIMSAINLKEEQVYLTNVVKCFPALRKHPTPNEQSLCLDYLRLQFLLQRPKLIICLGSIASKNLIDKKISVLEEHGKIIEKKGVIFIPTFHPSALLRDESKKPLAWEDWKVIKKTIISAKLADI